MQRTATQTVCSLCGSKFPIAAHVVEDAISVPLVLAQLIVGYCDQPDACLGYITMHKSTRRRHHRVCYTCGEKGFDQVLRKGRICSKCPCANCETVIAWDAVISASLG
jgi:hypothetical protein